MIYLSRCAQFRGRNASLGRTPSIKSHKKGRRLLEGVITVGGSVEFAQQGGAIVFQRPLFFFPRRGRLPQFSIPNNFKVFSERPGREREREKERAFRKKI